MTHWQEIKIKINRSAAEGAYGVLAQRGIETYVVEDSALMDQAQELGWGDYFPATDVSEQITITCYLPAEISSSEVQKLEQELVKLEEFGFKPGKVQIKVGVVDEQNWAQAWKDYYTPQRIGRILIQPSWLPLESGKDQWDAVIYLDPGMAFGSGTHPTTAVCLELLQGLNLEDKIVWDVGTGSGILAIAAAKYGANVQAVDIDPVAVRVAAENRDLNGLDFPISQGTLGELRGNPEVIVANIVAHVIGPMLPAVRGLLQPGGFFIAAGVIEDKDQEILKLAKDAKLRLLRRIQRGEWVSYLFQKGE